MTMKNKLNKHHKSKSSLLIKRFAIVSASVAGLFAIIALPTYISTLTNSDSPVNASEQVVENELDSNEEILTVETNED